MQMGLGKLGLPNLVFKRKYRWTFEIQNLPVGNIPKHYVKLGARPNLSIEETEINFLHGKQFIPGKGTWETITVTYYDVAPQDASMAPLWGWLASVYDFMHPDNLYQASTKASYSGLGLILLYDGCGTILESWTLYDIWPQAINFGELDYSSSEECTIELTMRYSTVKYEPKCGQVVQPICGGCGNAAQNGSYLTTINAGFSYVIVGGVAGNYNALGIFVPLTHQPLLAGRL